MESELTTSPRRRRKKISLASRNIWPLNAGQAASSTGLRGTIPYGRAMNSKRPAENPTWSFLESLFTARSCNVLAIRSACAIGPPDARIETTALPISMFDVRRNDSIASCGKSVQRPTSPCQCGTTGLLLDFCVSVERCA